VPRAIARGKVARGGAGPLSPPKTLPKIPLSKPLEIKPFTTPLEK
jgi:hypothetical protein